MKTKATTPSSRRFKGLDRITAIDDPFLEVRRGNLDVVRDWLASGRIRPETSRWSGFTLLHRAAELGETEFCQLLVQEAGVSPNIRTARGWYTPLHCALAHGYLDTAYALIALGGSPWIKSKYGEDAFDYGSKRGFRTLCDDFKNRVMKEEMKKSIDRLSRLSSDSLPAGAALPASSQGYEVEEVNEEEEEEEGGDVFSTEGFLPSPSSSPPRNANKKEKEQSIG
eukprot:gene2674-2919_t